MKQAKHKCGKIQGIETKMGFFQLKHTSVSNTRDKLEGIRLGKSS